MRFVVLLVFLAQVGVACGAEPSVDASADGIGGTVLVFAAASLTTAFADIEAAFEAEHAGVDVVVNLAGSSSLREQILGGAPADVFASANSPNMDQVVAADAVDGAPVVFARNRLEIAVPSGNPAAVGGLDDFARADLLIGLCAAEVPCGELARAVLELAGVDASIDTNEPDVRALLVKIEAGELDAGIVYASDVTASGGRLDGIELPVGSNIEATYPIAVLRAAPNPMAARALVDYVRSAPGQAILVAAGLSGA